MAVVVFEIFPAFVLKKAWTLKGAAEAAFLDQESVAC
jgi:hypothetical protein